MTEYIRVSKILENDSIGLKINMTTDSGSFNILHFQPNNSLSYSSDTGVVCNSADYEKKVTTFIDMARKENSALVISPEASIPYNVIFDIVKDPSKWPEEQNLWCLCSEGMSVEVYKRTLCEFGEIENIKVIVDDKITYKKHINSLWYLFRISSNELCVLIQLKQKPMEDRNMLNEAVDLSLGSKVYVFDLNNGLDTKNLLISLICADAIQLPLSEIITNLRHSHPIIINPQLNPKPFSSHFVTFRTSYFSDTSISKQRLITANWSSGTTLGTKISITESGSSYYNYLSVNGKHHIDAISRDSEIFDHRIQCHSRGMTNFCEDRYNIWNLGNDECVLHYYSRKEEIYGFNPHLGMQLDPHIKAKYFFAFEKEVGVLKGVFKCMVTDVNLVFSDLMQVDDNYLPISHKNCIEKKCNSQCDWLYNDYLFGISFGTLLRGEIKSNHEISNRATISLNNESLRNTKEKRKQFVELVKLLCRNEIPLALGMFKDNHKFEIDYDAARTGSDRIYNISIKTDNIEYPNWKDKKGLFLILDTDEKIEVEMLYDKLKKTVNKEYRDQIVIYYKSGQQYICFSEPYNNVKIGKSNNSFSNSTSSFLEGSMSYE